MKIDFAKLSAKKQANDSYYKVEGYWANPFAYSVPFADWITSVTATLDRNDVPIRWYDDTVGRNLFVNR